MPQSQANHFVILNWNIRALEVIRQIHSSDPGNSGENVVVVVTDDKKVAPDKSEEQLSKEIGLTDFHNVYFSLGDTTDEKCLENANILKARTILIMADDREGKLADEKSLRSLMAIQALVEADFDGKQRRWKVKSGSNKRIHVVIELKNIRNTYTVENIARKFPGTVDIIGGAHLRTLLLAQATIIEGLTGFYKDLLCFNAGNELYLIDITPLAGSGMPFPELASRIVSREADNPIIPVGLQRIDGEGEVHLITNPKRYESDDDRINERENTFYRLKEGDKLLVLAYSKPSAIELRELETINCEEVAPG